MSYESAAGRWWENYLVRYFMPSIAGIGIVAWLTYVGPADLREILFFGKSSASLDTPTLTLLVLYGNLFCYIASYPILCFHATRVIDFNNYQWKPHLTEGYIATGFFALGILTTSLALSGLTRIVVSFMLAATFVFIQLLRIRASLTCPQIKGYKKRPSPLVYAFLVTLAMRRGIAIRTTTSTSVVASDTDEENESTQVEEENRWKRELIDSYRHMREHGNSGFIFILELSLAAACYGIVCMQGYDGAKVLSILGALLALWSVPAAFIHMLGQYLERRYSLFDQKLP